MERMNITLSRWPAPRPLQGPVDGLHVTECKWFTGTQFSLTGRRKRVKSQSFFDIANVFPVGGESGIQARSPGTVKTESFWRAGEGLLASCWLRRTSRLPKAKIEAPSCWPIYPVDGEPGAQASARRWIKDRTLESFARNWTEKAGRQGSIANRWSRWMGQHQARGFLFSRLLLVLQFYPKARNSSEASCTFAGAITWLFSNRHYSASMRLAGGSFIGF